ncbi:MAG: YkgJ family cysteine cluster protein [Planctomycetota bacterium]|nr:YkgJ family cysteine cluster protein [Planctomycetota bacterium]
MASHSLSILTLNVKQQRYSCHGCGNCCHDFTVQLRDEDLKRLEAQGWEEKLGEPITIEFRGTTFLRQREDGACLFLQDDGLCRIHAEHGFEEKPIACQLFPFSLTPIEGQVAMGLNFSCQSVLENKGAALNSHVQDLKRMGSHLPEVTPAQRPPMLTRKLRASAKEIKAITNGLDRWLTKTDLDLNTRLDGLAFLVQSLAQAKLENVRDEKLRELVDVLIGALPGELEFHPLEPPTSRQMKLLRQAVFTRVEDPKLSDIKLQGRFGMILSQLKRSGRFKKGKGASPHIGAGWPEGVDLAMVEQVGGATDTDTCKAIDDLMTRYLRATVLGGRIWGAGYYGWPVVEGLQALLLNLSVIGWLSRLHSAGRGLDQIDLEAVRAALGRVDRTSGRAVWLGANSERARLGYLKLDDGLRRIGSHEKLTME